MLPASFAGNISFSAGRMRIDKYLKVSRLIKRRELAANACLSSRVFLNGKAAKPAAQVKIGDTIEIQFGANPLRIEVLSLATVARKEDAEALYRVLPAT